MLEQGPTATGKAATLGQGIQKKTVPERPRRESSTTALKAVTKIGGLSYPHKGKVATSRGIEDKGQQEAVPIPTISAEKRGRLQEVVV